MSELSVTRREAVVGTAALAGLSGCLARHHPDQPPAGQPAVDGRQTLYPLVTYESVDGQPVVTMPVNVRVNIAGSAYDLAAVEEVFRTNLAWSRLARLVDPFWPFHNSPDQYIYNEHTEQFYTPVASYRRPFPLRVFVGEIGYHTYLWPIYDVDQPVGVAIQAHKDVGSVFNHQGTAFDQAAGAVGSIFEAAGWQTEWSTFGYPVSQRQFDVWGPTGDLVLHPPSVVK